MQKQFLATGVVFLSCLFPLRAFAASFTDIYVFGDSLSDTGNLFAATGGLLPPSPPYSQGRASNDRLWIEYLAEDLGATTTNYAFGGATTGSVNTVPIPGLIGLEQQITNFQATNSFANPDALYVVWAGSNDYVGARITDPSVPVGNLASSITSLAESGAENFLVVNLPDVGKLPATNSSSFSSSLSTLTDAHNFGLDTVLNSLSDNINIYDVDVNSLFAEAIASPELFGFKNITDACLTATSICSKPDEYLFWDDLHPTTVAHEQIGDLALERLNSQPIPEPNSGLGILVFGALSAGAIAKRKYQKTTLIKVNR